MCNQTLSSYATIFSICVSIDASADPVRMAICMSNLLSVNSLPIFFSSTVIWFACVRLTLRLTFQQGVLLKFVYQFSDHDQYHAFNTICYTCGSLSLHHSEWLWNNKHIDICEYLFHMHVLPTGPYMLSSESSTWCPWTNYVLELNEVLVLSWLMHHTLSTFEKS